MVSAVAQVQSLAWEVPHTTGGAKKQKKKDKLTSWRGWGSRLSMGRGTDADSGDHGLCPKNKEDCLPPSSGVPNSL